MAYLDESDTSDLDHINTINECYDNIDEESKYKIIKYICLLKYCQFFFYFLT